MEQGFPYDTGEIPHVKVPPLKQKNDIKLGELMFLVGTGGKPKSGG